MTAESAPDQHRAKESGGLFKKVLLLSFSVFLAVGAAEMALRIRGNDRPPPWPLPLSAPGIYVPNEDIGFSLEPSTSKSYPYPDSDGRKLTVTANEFGFRDRRSFTEEDGRTRVCVLGDSFVFGLGVEANERFTDLVETRRPDWRLDNLGMSGYDPGLMLRSLDQVGRLTDPDLILLCIYTDDMRRHHHYYSGVGYPMPRYDLVDGELVTIPYPERSFLDNFSIKARIRRALWNRRKRAVLAAILDRIHEISRELEAPLAVVFLPDRKDFAIDQERRAWLGAWAEKADVPFLDLSDPIHAMEEVVAFIPNDEHYTPSAHAVVAEHIETFLASLLDR